MWNELPQSYGLKQQFIIAHNSVHWLDGSSVAFTWVTHMTVNAGQSAELKGPTWSHAEVWQSVSAPCWNASVLRVACHSPVG